MYIYPTRKQWQGVKAEDALHYKGTEMSLNEKMALGERKFSKYLYDAWLLLLCRSQ
jgi:hypothetical protein